MYKTEETSEIKPLAIVQDHYTACEELGVDAYTGKSHARHHIERAKRFLAFLESEDFKQAIINGGTK